MSLRGVWSPEAPAADDEDPAAAVAAAAEPEADIILILLCDDGGGGGDADRFFQLIFFFAESNLPFRESPALLDVGEMSFGTAGTAARAQVQARASREMISRNHDKWLPPPLLPLANFSLPSFSPSSPRLSGA